MIPRPRWTDFGGAFSLTKCSVEPLYFLEAQNFLQIILYSRPIFHRFRVSPRATNNNNQPTKTMKHASDFLRRPVPRRFPWKAWLYIAAQVIAFIICAAAALATLIFALAI